MSEWKKCKLGDVAKYVNRGIAPSYVLKDGILVLNQRTIRNGKIDLSVAKLSDQNRKINKDKILQQDDIVINSTGVGTAGRVAIFKHKIFCTIDSHVTILRLNSNVIDPVFGYYYLYNKENELERYAEGTTGQIELKRDKIKNIEISLPPLPEQKAIASVLSSLDDKIDLLHRQNKTLESMAETLFRQWFVEEAKDDWEEVRLGGVVDVVDNRGKTPPNKVEKTLYPVIEVNSLGKETRLVEYKVIKKYVTKDIFDSWFRNKLCKFDTILSTVGSIGAMSMFVTERGNVAQNVVGLHANNISPFYLYQFVKHKVVELVQMDIGGVQPSLKVPHLLSIKISLPNDKLLNIFDKHLVEIVKKMENNYFQLETLEEFLKILTNKLINRKICIKI